MQKRVRTETEIQWILLIILSVIWGSSFVLIKKGLVAFSPAQVGTLRIAFAFFVLLPFAIKNLTNVYKAHWKKIILLGFMSNLSPAILFAIAETGLSSSLAGILNALTPLNTLLFGFLIFRVNVKMIQFAGLLIGLAGSVALSFVNAEGGLGEFNHYALYVILATILYGISGNFIKIHLSKIHPVALTSLAMFSMGPVALIYLFSSDFFVIVSTVPEAWSSLLYIFILAAVGTALALILFNRLIQMTSAIFASAVTYMIPIVALLWGILDGEQLYLFHFVGLVLIISGVYLVNKGK